MLKYNQLTRLQKQFVNAAIAKNPALANMTEVPRQELLTTYYAMKEDREAGGIKTGYPQWLAKHHKTGRGTYWWPAPTAEDLENDKNQPTAKVRKPKKVKNTAATTTARQRLHNIITKGEVIESNSELVSDEQFLKELQEAGIEV